MKNKYVRHYVRAWTQHFSLQVATLVVLTGTFLVISISFLAHQNLVKILSQWGGDIKMSVYLEGEYDAKTIEDKISEHVGVESYKFINKNQAAILFQKQIKNYVPNLIFDKSFENPLPDSFEIYFKNNWGNKKFIEIVNFAKNIAKVNGVEDVSYGQNWVKNYATVVDKFNATSWFLTIILLIGSLFVIGNSIRSAVGQRRGEIEILELIGETANSIKGPYIVEGILQGLLASVLSIFIAYLIYNWQMQYFDSGVGLWGKHFTFQFLSLNKQAIIYILGGTFGGLGSYICVRRMNNGWSAIDSE